jgi:uncharacterized protein (DUF1684 family)
MHRCFSGLLLAAVAAISIDATDPAYEKQLLEWRKTRLAELTADDGWLTVVGLLWIHQGANHAGSASGMDLKMPSPAPQELGVFTLEGERVSFAAAPGVPVRVAGDSAARRAFKGLEYFPIREDLRVRARLEPFDPPRHVPIVNVLGDQSEYVSPGRLVFELDGVTHSLDAVYETSEKKDLFVIFRDRTSGESTYPAGRYMHVPLPVNGEVQVDFNRAYNPPCAFTEFATCPLPPKQNWLKVRIEAGEKTAHVN